MGRVLDSLLSPLHIVILLIVALLVFGPRRLPELGGAVGKTFREFQKSMAEARAQVQSATAVDDGKGSTAGAPVGTSADSAKPN